MALILRAYRDEDFELEKLCEIFDKHGVPTPKKTRNREFPGNWLESYKHKAHPRGHIYRDEIRHEIQAVRAHLREIFK